MSDVKNIKEKEAEVKPGIEFDSFDSSTLKAKPGDAVANTPVGNIGAKREFRKNKRVGGPKRAERVKSEFDQKIINIRRVTRVASGGRRFSFSVAIVIGNRNGSVGVGTGKAGDTSLAIDKASRNAKRNLVKINLTKNMSIPHDVYAKYGSAKVYLMPAPGRGIVSGSAVRDIIELGGIKDVNTKILSGSKNKLNIARTAILALSRILPRKSNNPEKVAVKK
ncbi:30S ribosomal protein S5 [Candidatus Nomurabacteria bacterium]|nr:30S ribosomal protein S5 [Candidatus Nomurabacteria bacterium]